MKRIVKELHSNGDITYRVETNRWFFGLLPCKWHVDTITVSCFCGDITCKAVFSTLKEAKIHCGIKVYPIIKEEIVECI